MKKHNQQRPARLAVSLITRCVLTSMLPVGAAMAIELNGADSDTSVRWDNTFRYNIAVRTEDQDQKILKAQPFTDGKFKSGDVITNRLDWLSELDAVYQGKHGFRISGAAWNDQAYSDASAGNPLNPAAARLQYNDTTKAAYQSGGEILDAFIFTNLEFGDVPVGVRAGKHVVYWGEGSLIGGHAISYSQAPSDGRKAVASPGIETKEVFMPINQISFNAQLNNKLSIGGQYFLDWQATRVPQGGTYFGASDSQSWSRAPAQKDGAFGLRLGYNLNQDSKLGLYYREFTDYTPWSGGLAGAPTAAGATLAHADGIKLYGVSYGATIAGTSVGWELSQRENAPLTSSTGITDVTATGARGTTYHMVLNATRALPNLPIYDTGVIVAELAYSHLGSITRNEANFKGVGTAKCTAAGRAGYSDIDIGCATSDYWGLSMLVNPQYLQVAPGLDLSVPLTLTYGLSGNAATGGGNEGEYSYSAGLDFMYQGKYNFVVKYQDRFQRLGTTAAGVASGPLSNGSTYAYNDRGFLSFTFKTSF